MSLRGLSIEIARIMLCPSSTTSTSMLCTFLPPCTHSPMIRPSRRSRQVSSPLTVTTRKKRPPGNNLNIITPSSLCESARYRGFLIGVGCSLRHRFSNRSPCRQNDCSSCCEKLLRGLKGGRAKGMWLQRLNATLYQRCRVLVKLCMRWFT